VRLVFMTIGVCAMVLSPVLAMAETPSERLASVTKRTPLIVASNEGERREFRTRPGVTFRLKVDPTDGGTEHLVVVTEDVAPGDRIPTHRHPHADELIFIQSGTARVRLGDKVQEAHAGGIVFIPHDTWMGAENIGKDRLVHRDVFPAPGFEEYMRAISVPAGAAIVALSKTELEQIRKKYSHYEIYQ
jgi:quercetin dioxygenase-like cupin family protein